MRTAVYPGSFDPITNGHLDIIERSSKVFDKVIVSILTNSSKKPAFTVLERIEMIKKATAHIPNVEVDSFDGLLVNYVNEKKSNVIIKGLRAISDFEYEFQMAHANKMLAPDIETLFMMSANNYQYLSSSLVKELANLNGSIAELVPECIKQQIEEKFKSA